MVGIILDTRNNRFSLINILLFFGGLLHSTQSNSVQVPIYSLIFCSPLIIGLLAKSSLRSALKSISILMICILLVLAISYPQLANILAIVKSQDVPRNFGQSLTFSYTTQTSLDWLSSLFFEINTINTGRHPFLLHETNYPLGIYLLFFIMFFPWKKTFFMGIGIVFSLFFIVAFSSNVPIFSPLVLNIFPILNSFRVPARGVIPIVLILIPFSLACLEHFIYKNKNQLLIIKYKFKLPKFFSMISFEKLFLLIMWSLLSTCSLNSFKERLPQLSDGLALESTLKELPKSMKAAVPEAFLPLNRSMLFFTHPQLLFTFGNSLGLFTLENLGFFNTYFLTFLLTLHNQPFSPVITALNMELFNSYINIFRRFYNLRWQWYLTPDHKIAFLDFTKETWGPAWIPYQLGTFNLLSELTEYLKSAKNQELDQLKNKLLLERDVAFNNMPLVKSNLKYCQHVKIKSISYLQYNQRIKISLDNSAFNSLISPNLETTCPLIVSTNYSSLLVVTTPIKDSSDFKNLKTFRAYGVLLGVIVPLGANEIEIFWQRPS